MRQEIREKTMHTSSDREVEKKEADKEKYKQKRRNNRTV